MTPHRPRIAACALVLSSHFAVTAPAGPLNPPAGAVGASMKTLAEIEPRTPLSSATTPGNLGVYSITQPGSYYLTANLDATPGKHAIEIAANNVTLDLNGYTVSGIAGNSGAVILIAGNPAPGVADPVGNITIRNGIVRGGAGHGINSVSNGARRIRLIDITVHNAGTIGYAMSDGVILERCSAFDNGSYGFQLGNGCAADNCVARANGGDEWRIGSRNTLINCTADNAAGSGYGFSASDGNTFTGCSACNSSLDHGFSVGIGNALSNCSAANNGGSGFGSNSSGNSLTGCSAADNGAHGFSFTGATVLANCNGFSNNQHGALVTSASIVSGCTFTSNGIDGLRVSNNCVATGNSCSGNGGSGILATSPGNRIDGNTVTANAAGISVAGGCVVIRNTASKNPAAGSVGANDFVLTGANAAGQVFDFTAGATITTGNSFANIKY